MTQYQTIKTSQDQYQQRKTQLTNRIGSIYEEIAELQDELKVLELELVAVNACTKAEDEQNLQLCNQVKALDSKIVSLAKKQKPLESALEIGNRELAETQKAWPSLLNKFYEAR